MADLGNVYREQRNLPHYTSRKEAGIGKEEPIYQNLFLVTIIPPTGVSGGDLLSAHVVNIAGMVTDQNAPVVEQIYKGAKRSFASGMIENTTVDLTLNFTSNLNENNQMYVYKILKAWKNRIHNPETGERGLKKNYVGQIVVEMHNREGDIFYRATFYDAFLNSALPEFGLDYSGGELINLDGLVFKSDYYKLEFA